MADAIVKVNGKEYPFLTESDLTLGELAEIERITGQGYDLMKMGPLGFLALTYVSVKRVDPRVALEDLQELKGDHIDLRVESEPIPPTSPAASGGNTPSGETPSGGSSDGTPEDPPEITGSPA